MTETVGDFRAELGEGPLWDARSGRIVWVDIPRGLLLISNPNSGATETIELGQPVGSVVPRLAGGYALALRDGFALLEDEQRSPRLIAPVEIEDSSTRMNDGKCDSRGRFWAGTMAEDETPHAGALYRLDCDGTVTRMLDDVTCSNGLAWNHDDNKLYYIDSGTYNVAVFDYDAASGEIHNRRTLASFRPEQGVPDGLAIDAEGCLWVALWGGGAIHRLLPNGATDRVVSLPATLITSVAFGGSDLCELFVTSARQYLSADEQRQQPLAGSLFRLDPRVQGRAPQPYRDASSLSGA